MLTEYEAATGLFQSTPPARGATTSRLTHAAFMDISIHAPREGGDFPADTAAASKHYFNPRPPRGGRPRSAIHLSSRLGFQSTPPARGATLSLRFVSCFHLISIHAPREGGDVTVFPLPCGLLISIHAPREGGDVSGHHGGVRSDYFNPRPPRGGRRHGGGEYVR